SNGAPSAQPGGDWGELAGNIVRGENLHESITRLAMKMLRGGAPEVIAVQILRGLLQVSQAPRDKRWQTRLGEIPRAVRSAQKKIAASAAAQANGPAQGATAPMSGNGSGWPPSPTPGGGPGAPPPLGPLPSPGAGMGSGAPPPSGPTAGPQPGPAPGPIP